MPSPDIDKLKAALADPIIDRQSEFGHGLFQDDWPYKAALIISEVLNAVPALIAEVKRLQKQTESALKTAKQSQDLCTEALNEVERLRGELAKAKTLGAVEELERVTRIFSPDEWNLIDSRQLFIQLAAKLRRKLA